MHTQELKSINDYELFLTETITPWSPQKRTALAATIAEQWLPAYGSFSAEERWGDTGNLRRGLDAIWGHIQGRALAKTDVARHIKQIEDVTPHMDDFEAMEALTACAALTDALQVCNGNESTIPYAARVGAGCL
jgi:uncharacterized protein YjaG (DUF416 family)